MNEPADTSPTLSTTHIQILFFATAAMVATLGLVAVVTTAWTGANFDHVSGAWLALATDLAGGLFYRPLYSEGIGYGGTRFQPLYFILVAALVRLGASAVAAALIINVASDLLLVAGVWRILRRLGLTTAVAAAWVAMLLASSSLRFGMTDGRSDVLATGLIMSGLAAVLGTAPTRRDCFVSGAAFALAFATKLTSVHGLAAVTIWLLLRNDWRLAGRVAGVGGVGVLVVAVLAHVLSGGRLLEMYRLTVAGGAGLKGLVLGPAQIIWKTIQYDPAGLVFFGVALTALVTASKRILLSLPAIYLACTILVTAAIFASPGTEMNHLIDVQVAVVLLIASVTRDLRDPKVTTLVASVAVAAFVGLFPIGQDMLSGRLWRSRLDDVRTIVEKLPRGTGLLLAEDPLVAVERGEVAYLLDAFMFRLVASRDREFEKPMLHKIQSREFQAVILLGDPESDWYTDVHFGRSTIDAIRAEYAVADRVGNYRILVPRE